MKFSKIHELLESKHCRRSNGQVLFLGAGVIKKTWIREHVSKCESDLGGHCIKCLSPGLPRWHSWYRTCLPIQETEKMRVQTLGLEDPLERKWQSTPALFPGKTHGQRSLADCSPWGWTQLSTWACTVKTQGTSIWGAKIGCHDFPRPVAIQFILKS